AAGRPFTLRPRGVRMLAAMTDRYPRFVAGCHDGATIEALEAAGVDRAEALTALDALTLSDGVELAAGHPTGDPRPATPTLDTLRRQPRPSTMMPPLLEALERPRRSSAASMAPDATGASR